MARIEKTVFIAYRRTDVYLALAVYQYLTSQGYDVFFDYASIQSGDFEAVIVSNIRARAHFIVILTPTSLDRAVKPDDWLRREIEIAIDEKRNIVPLFFKGFNFGQPSIADKLTGKLSSLRRYNGLNVHEDYFSESMERLNRQILEVPLDAVIHPVSSMVQQIVQQDQSAADNALEKDAELINRVVKESVESAQRVKEALRDQVDESRAGSGKPVDASDYVPNSVAAFLPLDEVALRSQPIVAPYTLIKRVPPTGLLLSLEPVEQIIPKIGVMDQWVKVLESSNREGYVAAWLLKYVPVVFPTEETALRTEPTISADTVIQQVPRSEPLISMEPVKDLIGKVGVTGQWVKVRDISSREGYVAAWLVRFTPDPADRQAAEVARIRAAYELHLLANNRSQAVLNDRAQGEDQLGIKDEVEALAETLLLRDVEPPIAVGVMGGWGSGKSFVMYLLSRYVEQIRAKAVNKGWLEQGKDQDDQIPAYVGHIYQINFNAWTYAKSNLWASLMDTIFLNLNRQMQVEQLLAHRECSPENTTNLAEDVRKSMLAGGNVFTKIYGEGLKFDQDKELKECKDNLEYWAHHLFKGNLLWTVMRRRQEDNLDRLKDTEEQLKQLKAGREQFEKSRSPEKKSVTLDASTAKTCAQTMLTALVAFIPEQVSKTAVQALQKQDVTEEDINQAVKEVGELRGIINAARNTFRENRFLRVFTILFLLIGLVLLILPTFNLDFIQRKMALLASGVAAILPFVSTSLYWWQKVGAFTEKAKVIVEDAYKNQQAKQAEAIANSTKKAPAQKITDLRKEIAQGSLAAYDTLINLLEAQAEAERQLIGPSAKYSSLMEFVQSRLDAATYENQLGLMHQVRQDIDELTYSLVDGAREDVFPRGKPRVILYIDDLDRCPPSRVVEILEAVQLLLNTKLFVIILGLDTRYVTRALEKEYKEILQHEGDPSGLDYIEKIIQIPYRVRPIERDNLQNYLSMQMDVEKPREPEPELPVQAVTTENSPSTSQGTEKAAVDTSGEELEKTPDTTALYPDQSQLSKVDLPPAVIQFKQEDLLDLTACCQQIPLSPRSIKRLVNVFKLMKIFWFRANGEADIIGRDQPRPVKQAAMCMLALSSAYPEVMREVFVHLEGLYRQGKEQSELFNELNSIKLPPGSAHDLAWQLQKYKSDVSTLKMMAGNEQDKLSQLTLKDFKLSTFNIVRSFSFVGDPMYWTDGEDDASRTNGKSEAKPAGRARKKQALP